MNLSKLHFVVANIVDIFPSCFYKGQRCIEHYYWWFDSFLIFFLILYSDHHHSRGRAVKIWFCASPVKYNCILPEHVITIFPTNRYCSSGMPCRQVRPIMRRMRNDHICTYLLHLATYSIHKILFSRSYMQLVFCIMKWCWLLYRLHMPVWGEYDNSFRQTGWFTILVGRYLISATFVY